MYASKLEKDVWLYKNQFDKFVLDIFGDYRLDRTSIDLDGVMFRMRYMATHKKGSVSQYEWNKCTSQFITLSTRLRSIFAQFIKELLAQRVGIFNSMDSIIDIFAQNVKIDSANVRFRMILISDDEDLLEFINSKIPEGEVFNIFPNEYFRYYTDSYNDAITKTYPELFENRHQDKVGTGADGDVFVHNFTFQTSERCSLNCTYCFGEGTRILMADYTYKNIEDIMVGDMVFGCKESLEDGEKNYFFPTKVTQLFHHKEKYYEIEFAEHVNAPRRFMRVTRNHPIMLSDGTWKEVKDIDDTKDILQSASVFKFGDEKISWNYSSMVIPMFLQPRDYDIYCGADVDDREIDVYNIETESHTYIANNLVVHNCYQFNKTNMRMSFDTAKKFIDDLLDDKYGYINRYNSPAIIIEFIGGEPLLEIKLTRQIYEYFLDRCYELNHPWFTMHRLSICSNGLSYFDEEVQSFFKDYSHNISFNISIDGNKELHDSCRIQPNGEGSYDIDIAALNHYNKYYTKERNSKMTLAPSNIGSLYESVVDFIKNGMKSININCVFEEGWNQETARTEYEQLKKLADYILDNDLENIYIAIFNERQEDMQDKYSDGSFCGGGGSMLALRPNGQFYPCIRYMPTSVGNNVDDLCIGTVDDGIKGREEGSEILQMMDNITRRSQNNDICYECPIGNDCASCLALGHTVFGTPNKRTNFICIQMIAEALANVYYWNLLNTKHPEYKLGVRKNNVPDEWSLLVIDKDELDFLKNIESLSMIETINKMNKDDEDE